jgi:hypothetical protein
MDDLYGGRLAWRVRIPSWLILALPAWFIDPWLVLPAIVLTEVVWIIAMQWSWRRDQLRASQRPQTWASFLVRRRAMPIQPLGMPP